MSDKAGNSVISDTEDVIVDLTGNITLNEISNNYINAVEKDNR